MFYDVNNPDITLSDWERLREEYPPHLIDAVLSRDEAYLPDWFVPLAWGVAVASDTLLHQAGYRHGMRRPRDWIEIDRDRFLYPLILLDCSLHVRRCMRTPLWAISRNPDRQDKAHDALVFEFGWTPIFTRSYQAAMQLAMHCHTKSPPAGLRWINTAGDNSEGAREIARKRCRDAALCPLPAPSAG